MNTSENIIEDTDLKKLKKKLKGWSNEIAEITESYDDGYGVDDNDIESLKDIAKELKKVL